MIISPSVNVHRFKIFFWLNDWKQWQSSVMKNKWYILSSVPWTRAKNEASPSIGRERKIKYPRNRELATGSDSNGLQPWPSGKVLGLTWRSGISGSRNGDLLWASLPPSWDSVPLINKDICKSYFPQSAGREASNTRPPPPKKRYMYKYHRQPALSALICSGPTER